jgi:methylmalonyl-CoA epimerase
MGIAPVRLDHVGIAVKDVDEASRFYEETLGLKLIKKETVTEERVRVAIFKVGESHVELLEATSPESSIARFIEKRGEGIHHFALAYDDVKAATEYCRMKGATMIYPEPEVIENNRTINFVHPKSTHGVLVELIRRFTE